MAISGANLRHLTEKITKSTSKYHKDILTDDENYHDTQQIKHYFGVKVCCYLILKTLVSQSLQIGQKLLFLYFKPILLAIFVTIAEFYTWIILLINQSREICQKQLSVFGSRGGKISPLMHVALCLFIISK